MWKPIAVLLLSSALATAQAADRQVYQTDKNGNIRHDLPSFRIKSDGAVIQTSPSGQSQRHLQQYKIVGDKIYHANSQGSIQRNLPHYRVSESGRAVQYSPIGQRMSHKQQYQIDEDSIKAVDKYGR